MKIKLNFFYPAFMLFLVFLILKLTNTIAWSWVWVTAPIWIVAGISLMFGFCVLFFLLFCGIFVAISGRKNNRNVFRY